MISIQRYKYIFKYSQIQNTDACTNTGGPCFSGTNGFINFWFRFFDMRRETQFLKVFRDHTMPPTPPTFGTSRGVLDLNSFSASKDPKNSTVCLIGRKLNSMAENSILCSNGRNSIVCLHGPIKNPQLTWFLKSSNSEPISSEHDVIHTPAPFPVWDLLWQWWLSYSLRTSVNCTQWYALELLTRIVQSPTKLNDEILLMKND